MGRPADWGIIPGLMDIAIRCRALRKIYDGKPPVEALRGLDLEVGAGECFGILGPNGAGKTTTVEILEGYRVPDSGSVSVLGEDPQRAGTASRSSARSSRIRACPASR